MQFRKTRVFIDSCAVNRFAGLNLDPAKELAGSAFALAATPDLKAEYAAALAHRYVEPHIKALLKKLLAVVTPTAPPCEAEASRGTDHELGLLSATSIVVTVDTKPPWDRVRTNPGLVLWPDLESRLRQGESLRTFLQAKAVCLPSMSALQQSSDGSTKPGLQMILNVIANTGAAAVSEAEIVAVLQGSGGGSSLVRTLFSDVSLDCLKRFGAASGLSLADILATYRQAKITVAAANPELDRALAEPW